MNPADLKLAKEPLASGAFGDVFRAEWRGTSVVAKRLKPQFAKDARALAELRAELSIWCRVHHVSGLPTTLSPGSRRSSVHSLSPATAS